MQRIVTENITSIKAERVWKLLTDINNYPNFIKFVRKIKDRPSDFKEGVYWTDITNIVWIPLLIKHKIIKIEKNKKFTYELFLPFGGTMIEECELTTDSKGTHVRSEIKFTFRNYLLDLIFGAILKKRLKEMLEGTFRNIASKPLFSFKD